MFNIARVFMGHLLAEWRESKAGQESLLISFFFALLKINGIFPAS